MAGVVAESVDFIDNSLFPKITNLTEDTMITFQKHSFAVTIDRSPLESLGYVPGFSRAHL